MSESLGKKVKGLGTSAVFLTAISTILGAIMFLRFGYAVGHTGFIGAILIVLVGHMVTIPTALAIAEIATNQKVEGGGEYYIISRSFGMTIGGTIGLALYLSQAISVAFYIIAFAQAFDPVVDFVMREYGLVSMIGKKIITLPTATLLVLLILKKGADIGMKALYFVVVILFVSLVMFFFGSTEYNANLAEFPFNETADNSTVGWPLAFAICFPGFTGMTAGVGLSGDLKNPSKSIPLGTIIATICGMIIYIGIVYKLAAHADPNNLANNQLVMSDIALWGPIIPIGLAAATISSALGSIIVAPRTIQAIGKDNILPFNKFNSWISRGKKDSNEPANATLFTSAIVLGIILLEDVNLVAEIISMFFMLTYGALCLISFLEHFAADPAYRPSFVSKWWVSMIGAIFCFGMMFYMNPFYAILAIALMVVFFLIISYFNKEGGQGMARIFQGVIFQLSRKMQVFLQKVDKDSSADNWRPSVVCISKDSFERFAAFDTLRWISHKYGFGTYIHSIENYLSKDTHDQSIADLERLIKLSDNTHSNVYLDTVVSPSVTAGISQVLQLPGISGKENNMIMFEFAKDKPTNLDDIVDNYALIKSTGFDVCILGSSIRSFGFHRNIHIWITSSDFENANLMILMGYIILGHPDWKKGTIKLFAIFPEEKISSEKEKLKSLIESGRLPISQKNIELIPKSPDKDDKTIINEKSKDADLTILGFRNEVLKHSGADYFKGYEAVGDILFVNTVQEKIIK